MIDSASPRMIPGDLTSSVSTGSSLAVAAAAAAAAAVQASEANRLEATMPAQKTPSFGIQELLGLTNDQVKNHGSSGGGGGSSSIGVTSGSGGGVAGAAAAAMGGNFPPISCYNSSFFNDQYSQHQRMYFNSGLFGNLHSQSQSFMNNTSAASHLLDSTLRSDHTLSSKYQLL